MSNTEYGKNSTGWALSKMDTCKRSRRSASCSTNCCCQSWVLAVLGNISTISIQSTSRSNHRRKYTNISSTYYLAILSACTLSATGTFHTSVRASLAYRCESTAVLSSITSCSTLPVGRIAISRAVSTSNTSFTSTAGTNSIITTKCVFSQRITGIRTQWTITNDKARNLINAIIQSIKILGACSNGCHSEQRN